MNRSGKVFLRLTFVSSLETIADYCILIDTDCTLDDLKEYLVQEELNLLRSGFESDIEDKDYIEEQIKKYQDNEGHLYWSIKGKI